MSGGHLARVLVVIPAYNEASRLPRLLADVASYLRSDMPRCAMLDVHFLVVDDGSRTEEFQAVQLAVQAVSLPALAVTRLEHNRGKGAAIRAGFERGLEEGYELLAFMDADSSVAVGEAHRVIAHLAEAAPGTLSAVIGSRVKMLGRQIIRHPFRHYTGRVFATFVSVYFGQPVYDTQCGVKAFTRDAVRRHLAVASDTRWVWDTELLLAILDAGETVEELPVDWKEAGNSKVSFISDPLRMVWRLVRFRRELRARGAARRTGERA